ncbi:kinase [Fusarium albosuccineum]|uniref:Kinase n=1 Tax=Fusarium albosuccineum TaxID=1237068 RepID=A0A8H4L2C3_9HYPO|nr:kinase [Fusarium albosuccineum]
MADHAATTPLPYAPGKGLDLKAPNGLTIQALITRVYSMTMSPVLEVRVEIDGKKQKAVLKLYDRRFVPKRHLSYADPEMPHSTKTEAAWVNYISSGMADSLIEELKYEDEVNKPGFVDDSEEEGDADDDSDDKPGSEMEELGEIECRAHHDTQRQYKKEVEAYRQLQALQGRHIPKFFVSITLDSIPTPDGLSPSFFQIPGILIEHIPGFSLRDLKSKIPDSPEIWKELIQDAINPTFELNGEGVIHLDCQPRNFIVSKQGTDNYRVYMVDFAICWLRSDYKDTSDEDDEAGYPWNVRRSDNGEEIGCIMANRCFRGTAVQSLFKLYAPGVLQRVYDG